MEKRKNTKSATNPLVANLYYFKAEIALSTAFHVNAITSTRTSITEKTEAPTQNPIQPPTCASVRERSGWT